MFINVFVLIYLAVSVVMMAWISKEMDKRGIPKSIANYFACFITSLVWPYPVCLAVREFFSKRK